MKILVFGINYYPELTGIGKYTTEMCEWFAARGHSVSIITAMPYYPQWRISSAYRGKLWHKEVINRVKIYRVPLYVPANVTGISRIIHEFSFACASLVYWIPSLFKKYHCIIAVCPPFHLGFQAIFYRFFKKTPIIYHIQDLQVDAARTLGIIKSNTVLNFLEKAEHFIINRVTRVSSISPGMKDKILKKGLNSSKYLTLPNWVELGRVSPIPKELSLKKELGFANSDKIVLYSGNLGEKQGLEMIIEAAEELKGVEGLYFVFVGEGAIKSRLIEMVDLKNLNNVKFFPLQPYNKLSQLLAIADLHLVLQKKAAADLLFPSKLMSILSAGGVAIVTAEPNTDLYNLITHNTIGLIISPENTVELQKVIQENILKDNESIRVNARNYALSKLNIENILGQFEHDLKNLYVNG